MEQHKCLYSKNSSIISPGHRIRINRELVKQTRSRGRNDNYFLGRNIVEGPSSSKTHSTLTPAARMTEVEQNKENNVPEHQEREKIADKMADKPVIAEVDNRKREYLLRFIQWKENKKEQVKKKIIPFVPAGIASKPALSNAARSSTTTSSFAPKNHKFQPPAKFEGYKNLELPIITKTRKSIYVAVPTPPRKRNTPMAVQPPVRQPMRPRMAAPPPMRPLMSAPPPVRQPMRPPMAAPPPMRPPMTVPPPIRPLMSAPPQIIPRVPAGTASKPALSNAGRSSTTTSSFAPKNQKFQPPAKFGGYKNLEVPITTKTRKPIYDKVPTPPRKRNPPMAVQPPVRQPMRPAMAAPPPMRPPMVAPPMRPPTVAPPPMRTAMAAPPLPTVALNNGTVRAATGGAIKKAKTLQRKRDEPRMPSKNGNLAVNMKAKPSNASKSRNVGNTKLTINCRMKLGNKLLAIETPVLCAEKASALITSTAVRNPSLSARNSKQDLLDLFDATTPMEPMIKGTMMDTPKKRNSANQIFNFIVDESAEEACAPIPTSETIPTHHGCAERPLNYMSPFVSVSKKPNAAEQFFNFIVDESAKEACQPIPTSTSETTPTRDGCAERPLNYMSPFVSVCRGKVNARMEREKRNSVYLTGGDNDGTLKPETEEGVEVRRTLAAVEYYRKQLRDEITRLEADCLRWEEYKLESLPLLQETGGDDMINATIGQTRLLITKKLMQFSGLIERCEANATGVGAVIDDGSEDTKPINTADLEGFWCMVGLQINNIDKRFENLQRWKENEWRDPEEEPIKIKSQSTKVIKRSVPNVNPKRQGKNTFIKMMRNIHAQIQKKEASEAGNIICAAKATQSRRIPQIRTPNSENKSFFVRDRKSFSHTPTIITISKSSQSPLVNQSHKDLKSSKKHSNELRRTAVMQSCNKTPQTSDLPLTSHGRKSILKTPGSAKGQARNVLFNEKSSIRKFNFIIDDDEIHNKDDNELHDEINSADSSRTYSLRTRKVKLRPSSEIIIPTKKDYI